MQGTSLALLFYKKLVKLQVSG